MILTFLRSLRSLRSLRRPARLPDALRGADGTLRPAENRSHAGLVSRAGADPFPSLDGIRVGDLAVRADSAPVQRGSSVGAPLPLGDQPVWRVIAERTDLAYLELVPASVIEPRKLDVTERAAGARAATHLWAGRFLLNCYRDRYVRAGATALERLRRHREMEGYLSAFAEALAYARAQAEGERSAPWPPRLFQTGGQLPLLQRYRRDRHAYTAVV